MRSAVDNVTQAGWIAPPCPSAAEHSFTPKRSNWERHRDLHRQNRAEDSGSKDFARLRNISPKALVVAHGNNHTFSVRCFQDSVAILRGGRYRLLYQQVLPALDGLQRFRNMNMVGGRNQNGINIITPHKGPGIRLNLETVGLSHLGSTASSGYGDSLHLFYLAGCLGMSLTHEAGARNSKANLLLRHV
jgi:hypothetical protein